MSIEQMVDTPADHRLSEVPREIPEEQAAAKRKPISRYFGILSPKTYGDVVAYQRKLREEWNG